MGNTRRVSRPRSALANAVDAFQLFFRNKYDTLSEFEI
jgi:hypothetical protein